MDKSITRSSAVQAPEEFEFPCSASFRKFFADEDTRTSQRLLSRVPRDSREQELLEHIAELERENFRLRVAFDITRLALNQRRPQRPSDTGYGGLDP